MRIWDIHPGYLNRHSLLGEHRELHGLVSILVNGKKGYAQHPETKRWVGYGWALRQRHRLLAAEMALRGYKDQTPVRTRSGNGQWPQIYIDDPYRQFQILVEKYRHKEQGRIPLPKNAQQLWSQHKYSILARNVILYRKIGKAVAAGRPTDDYSDLARQLTEQLRKPPARGGVLNALQHMWGYVSGMSMDSLGDVSAWSPARMLREIQRRAVSDNIEYLISSTALSDLKLWVSDA
jgi:hypothetical protein